MGRITYLANTPEIAQVVLKEGEYFTKAPSVPDHPLYGIRDEAALFVCDTDHAAWKDSHKFIPPSMTPRAVKHYTPVIQKSVDASFNVLDQIDARGEAFNVHQFTAKLTSQVICQLVLGVDLHHFESIDTLLHKLIQLIQQYLTLNRRVQSKGTWYQYLPFGECHANNNSPVLLLTPAQATPLSSKESAKSSTRSSSRRCETPSAAAPPTSPSTRPRCTPPA